jgi:Fe-S oxidoreductase
VISVHDLLKEYIETGRIKLDKTIHEELTTVHDPCNYGRKSFKTFGVGYFEEPRWITQQCCANYVEMNPTKMNNYCCGAGGGAWAMPYNQERIFYGREKARQIKDTGAKMVVAPCHNCRDQIMKSLNKEYDLGIKVKYLWELVADSLLVEPWNEEEIKKANELRDAQYERDDVDLDKEW